MFYLNLSLNAEKVILNEQDYRIVFFSWFPLFCGFLLTNVEGINSEYAPYMAAALLIFAGTSFFSALIINLKNSLDACTRLQVKFEDSKREPCAIDYMIMSVAIKNLTCSKFMIVMMPLFPVFYFLRALHFISGDTYYVVTSLMNFGSKGTSVLTQYKLSTSSVLIQY